MSKYLKQLWRNGGRRKRTIVPGHKVGLDAIDEVQEPASEEENAVDFGGLNVGPELRFKVVIFSPLRPTVTAESCILDMTTA